MSLQETLQKVGMNEKQASIYLVLLELGQAPVSSIARKTKLNRSTIYDQLSVMDKRGWIFEIFRKNLKYFSPLEPDLLVHNFQLKVHELSHILPELKNLFNKFTNRPKIRFFDGWDGIKQVYEDTLLQSDYELYAFTSYQNREHPLSSFFREYIKNRAKKNIKAYVISPYSVAGIEYEKKDTQEKRETLLIKESWFTMDVEIQMYQNKVSFVSFGQEQVGLIIESEGLYSSLKNIFHLVWELRRMVQ
jgi:sugar-specific transcriptional regulator TrmB